MSAPVYAPPTCFLKKTMIDAMYEHIAVENIKVGDEIKFSEIPKVDQNKISNIRTEKVKWVGKKIIYKSSLTTQQSKSYFLPVKVSKDALFDNIPNKDLYLSPFHSVFIDGGLVAIGNLCNGVTIRQCDGFEKIEYYHLEFEKFGIVKAHGTLCETFFNIGNRSQFDNVDTYLDKHHDDENITPPFFRCLNKDGIKQLKYRLLMRALFLLNEKRTLSLIKEPDMYRCAI